MPDPEAAYATAEDIEAHIAFRLNAAREWAGDIVKLIYSPDAITKARQQSTAEVFGAIASNPKHGLFGLLSEMVTVAHNADLPAHDGEPGIPWIVPYADAAAREGLIATATEIDSWRTNPEAFTGLYGAVVAHDQVGAAGKMSPLACRWAITNSRLKFTGLSAQVPLVIITAELVESSVLLSLEATVVKLSMPKLIKPGSAISAIARQDAADGRDDLLSIQRGAMSSRPLSPFPDIALAQRGA